MLNKSYHFDALPLFEMDHAISSANFCFPLGEPLPGGPKHSLPQSKLPNLGLLHVPSAQTIQFLLASYHITYVRLQRLEDKDFSGADDIICGLIPVAYM